jgi:hypothetical protein
MAPLTTDLSPEQEERLRLVAEQRGQALPDCAAALLNEKLAEVVPPAPEEPWAGLPRRSWAEIEAMAREQGAPLTARYEDLLGSFWPEDETGDEFIAGLREWRRERSV